jgi:hypothetical protein
MGHAGLAHDRFGGATRMGHFHGLDNFNRHGFNRNGFGSRQAWNRWGRDHWGAGWNHWGAGWGGWYGPVFWPYLYGDVFSYLLWPDNDYDPFWSYGSDFFLSSLFWPGPNADWSDAQYDGIYDIYGAGAAPDAAAGSSASSITASCSGLAPGVTDLPINRMRQAVHPAGDQVKMLTDLQSAASKASDVVKASCPTQVPLTPPARLDAVIKRLDAMTQAVQMVRAPLETFYGSLTDAQKTRLAAVGAAANRRSSVGSQASALCDPRAAGNLTQLPVDRIEQTIHPAAQQQAAFNTLKTASASAAAALASSCPATTPATPVERIDAVAKRLNGMVHAANSVRPALEAFYATLSDQQKAQFNIPGVSTNAAGP